MPDRRDDIPVVCMGGSAGGLDAHTRLLRNLPGNFGVAIVIVNHVRHVIPLLHKILSKHTPMPVELITDQTYLKVPPTVAVLNLYACPKRLPTRSSA